MSKTNGECIEGPGGLPLINDYGLNTNQPVDFTGASVVALPANTTAGGSTVLTSADIPVLGVVFTDQSTPQTIGTTGARLAKLWVTDITSTNAIVGSITGNAATATSATNATSATTAGSVTGLTFVSGKTLTVNNILTLAGTDSTTMTFPATTASIARIDAAQSFSGIQTFVQVITTNNAITASGNAATVPITSRLNTVTNNSAATLTITLTTTSAVDGQLSMIRILDATGVSQTLVFVNTENSNVSVPTTSNGSTTLPLTVGFQYNNATSKWRCIALS